MRFARAATALVCVLAVPRAGAQLTEPWQTNWIAFGQQAAPLFLTLPAPGPEGYFTTFQQYANREFEWTGSFSLIESGLVGITMPNVGITFQGNVPGTLFAVIGVPTQLSQWTGYRSGQTVTFRGRIDGFDREGWYVIRRIR